ncbi:16S rRNA (cytosine(1402)-N(4))-methyltransferase RsmH, partial [Patescibacteria group bacterium]|nr:16S rRNA (cytosine(1402)-N(4))-methyltransferase RsmH [Patescibacteria group bacterium]
NQKFGAPDAILFDLGLSSPHVDMPERGFSFREDGPLDMRYDTTQELTAQEIVNTWSVDELTRVFHLYGEEERARDIASGVVKARREKRIETTTQLADIITRVKKRREKIHPATKVFQALRIAVNDELHQIDAGLRAAVDMLKPGGRLAAISFHSLEDRLVKHFFKSDPQLKRITKKIIRPSVEEITRNPRARSAKLRIAEKIVD